MESERICELLSTLNFDDVDLSNNKKLPLKFFWDFIFMSVIFWAYPQFYKGTYSMSQREGVPVTIFVFIFLITWFLSVALMIGEAKDFKSFECLI